MTVEIAHGTPTAYSGHGCRCDECRRANADRQKRYRDERRRIGRPPEHVHGTNHGYDNYGCRCAPCKQANADAARARQQKIREDMERLIAENSRLQAEIRELRGVS